MEEIPTLAQLIKQAIDYRILDVHTALIARVESYDHKTQLVDAQPILKRAIKTRDRTLNQEDLPMLVDVPVLFLRANEFFLSLPIKKGDFVQIIFYEVSIDEFLTEKSSSIDSGSRFSLHDAVAIPGVYPLSKPLTGAHNAKNISSIKAVF